MTVLVMISNFLLEYDRLSSASAPGYENIEIIRFLNKAQIELVNELYRNKQYMLIDEQLLTCTYTAGGVLTYPYMTGAKYFDLNSATYTTRYMYYIKSFTKLSRTYLPTMTTTIVGNDDIQKEEAKYYVSNAFNTPIFRYPKAFIDGQWLVVIPDGYTTITEVSVDYLSEPRTLTEATTDANNTATCDLKTILHDTIVTKAVEMALKAGDLERAVPTIQLNKQ